MRVKNSGRIRTFDDRYVRKNENEHARTHTHTHTHSLSLSHTHTQGTAATVSGFQRTKEENQVR